MSSTGETLLYVLLGAATVIAAGCALNQYSSKEPGGNGGDGTGGGGIIPPDTTDPVIPDTGGFVPEVLPELPVDETAESLGLITITDDMSAEERAAALEHNTKILESLLD